MLRYVSTRLVSIVLSLVVASAMIFLIMNVIPGDVAQMILGADASPEALAALRQSMGLDQNVAVRYLQWLAGVLQGDFGQSLGTPGFSVAYLLTDRLGNSLALAALATAFVVPVALVGGTYCGLNPGSPVDRVVSFFSMIWISLPEFASAVFLIMIFSKALGLLPSMSGLDLQMSLASQWKAFILPALTLSLITMGYVLRMVRAGVIEVANSEYVRIARLSGVSRGTVLRKYIIRNALAPSIAIIAMNTGWMIGGLVVVETIFAFPGLGTLLLQAVVQRDVPLIQAAALCSVAAYMLLNFVADVLTILLTPQLRLD